MAGIAGVGAVGVHVASFDDFGEIRVEDFIANVADELRVLHGEGKFDAAIEVAGHHVGTAEIDLFFASIVEVEDAAVLEEAADDAGDADIVADSGHAGAKAADAADEEIELDPGLGGFVEELDDAAIDEGVDLEDDVAAAAVFLVLDFAAD